MINEEQIEQIPYYLTWAIRHEVMYPEKTIEDVKLPGDQEGLHFGFYRARKLISIVSLFELGAEVQLRKFATLDAEQGKGYGKKLLSYAIDFAQHTTAGAKIWCNARVSALPFYEKFGFAVVGETWHENGHTFVRMEKSLG